MSVPDEGYLFLCIEGNGGWKLYTHELIQLNKMYHFLLIFRDRVSKTITAPVCLGISETTLPAGARVLSLEDVRFIFRNASHPAKKIYGSHVADSFRQFVVQ